MKLAYNAVFVSRPFFLVFAVVSEIMEMRMFLARAHHRKKKNFIDGYFAGLCKVSVCS